MPSDCLTGDPLEELNKTPSTCSSSPITTEPVRQWPSYAFDDVTLDSYTRIPNVLYVTDVDDANTAVASLTGPLGFDLEWTPSGHAPTALLQLADGERIVLVHLSAMSTFPIQVKAILEDAGIMKLGVGVKSDALRLHREFHILPVNMVDLSALAKLIDVWTGGAHVSLACLSLAYLHRTLPKGSVRMSDWARELTFAQQMYAANDAHCARSIYLALQVMAAQMPCPPLPSSYSTNLNLGVVIAADHQRWLREGARARRRERIAEREREEFEFACATFAFALVLAIAHLCNA